MQEHEVSTKSAGVPTNLAAHEMAKSARLRMEYRPGFKLMLQAIVAGEAMAVIAVNVGHLLHAKYSSESGKFIEMSDGYQVIVVTQTFIYDFLSRFYNRNGFEGLTRQYGAISEQVQLDGVALARYAAKRQEGTTIRLHTVHELTRADLKKGHAGLYMPFDITCEFFEKGDKALLDLWHEFERESFGRSVLRFTKGLRARLLPNEAEKTDEELAALDVGGVDAVRFAGWLYRKIARAPGIEGKVLTTLDTGGFAALVELLTVYHLDNMGAYAPLEDAD